MSSLYYFSGLQTFTPLLLTGKSPHCFYIMQHVLSSFIKFKQIACTWDKTLEVNGVGTASLFGLVWDVNFSLKVTLVSLRIDVNTSCGRSLSKPPMLPHESWETQVVAKPKRCNWHFSSVSWESSIASIGLLECCLTEPLLQIYHQMILKNGALTVFLVNTPLHWQCLPEWLSRQFFSYAEVK